MKFYDRISRNAKAIQFTGFNTEEVLEETNFNGVHSLQIVNSFCLKTRTRKGEEFIFSGDWILLTSISGDGELMLNLEVMSNADFIHNYKLAAEQ